MTARCALHDLCMDRKPRLNAFGIVAADLAATVAFYRELGLDLPEDATAQPHVEVDLGGGIRLMFDTVDVIRSVDPEWAPPQGGHRVALAFECESPTTVDEMHARMVSLGYRSAHDPYDAFWGQRYATLLDPDDNPVDLYAPLPADA